jgi:aerobic-type carbon monoxide dehydrogenase small subunit (CoxS/CutS family)
MATPNVNGKTAHICRCGAYARIRDAITLGALGAGNVRKGG